MKYLFLCILALSNVIIKSSQKIISISNEVEVEKIFSASSSQNQLSELDPTATGNPLPLDSSRSSTVGSPVRLSPILVVPFSENPVTRNSYNTNPSVVEENKDSEQMFMSITCCPFFILELFGCKKKYCCYCCCCSDEAKEWCFSCCCM